MILRTHSREHIVGVHNNMYKGIEQTEEGTVTTRGEFYTKPNGHRHATVVNNVQCGDLTLFFTQNKEYLKKIKKKFNKFDIKQKIRIKKLIFFRKLLKAFGFYLPYP